MGKGDVHIRWFAKKVDYTTPLYNDSILYRQEYSYYHNISNTYRSNLYNARDGIPVRNISLISQPSRYGYFDPYVVRNIFFIYLIISYSAVPNFRGALTLLLTLESRINKQVVYWKMTKNPTYTHLFGTIRLLIFSKKSHLYVYSHLHFYYFLRNFPTYILIQTRRLFGTLE